MFVPWAARQIGQQIAPVAAWADRLAAGAGVWVVASGVLTRQLIDVQQCLVEAEDLAGAEDPEHVSAGLTWTAGQTLPRNLSLVS